MSTTPQPRTRQRHLSSRTKRRTPEGRLARALIHGSGHVAVIGRNAGDADALLAEVVETIGAHRLVHLDAAQASPASVASALLDGVQSDEGSSTSATREALAGLLKDARRDHSPIVVVADDADHATAEQLDRLRLALEFAPGTLGTVKLVLPGTTSLERTLSASAARSLASRISARVQAPATGRGAATLLHRARGASRPVRLASLATAAAACVALILPAVMSESPRIDGRLGNGVAPSPTVHPEVKLPADASAKPEHGPTADTDSSSTPLALAAAGLPAPLAPARDQRASPTPSRTAEVTRAAARVPHAPTRAPARTPGEQPVGATSAAASANALPHAPGPAGRSYVLQVGSFRSQANAARLESRLAERFPGVGVSRFERDGTVYHRVRIGGLTDLSSAVRTAAQLATMGIDSLRIRTDAAPAQ